MLEQILETKKREIASLVLPDDAGVPHVSFINALQNPNHSLGLIAEVKKASPSKGIIKEAFDPVQIAKAYEKAGADAISVLTDHTYFQGDRAFIPEIKRHVDLPVLRKDFIIAPEQVEESRLIGADAILLIVAALDVETVYDLYRLAGEKGMDCLVEVHNEEELTRLLKVFTPKIIGVNNRDLTKFQTSLSQSEKLADSIPDDALFISESGIATYADIRQVQSFGAGGVLVGEALMRAETPGSGIQTLFGGEYSGASSS
ncbi:MAG TPA: indole-3-glycerol phosphate synthase TrpC [Bacillales bacterium]|nr:indole-3-glycerol phosphate synthase TrpC [Bacillales bacterium]